LLTSTSKLWTELQVLEKLVLSRGRQTYYLFRTNKLCVLAVAGKPTIFLEPTNFACRPTVRTKFACFTMNKVCSHITRMNPSQPMLWMGKLCSCTNKHCS
jgi:hypothetical protein